MFVDAASLADIILIIGAGFLFKHIYVHWYFSDDGSGPPVTAGRMNYLNVIALVAITLYAALWRRGHYRYENFENWKLNHGGLPLGFTVLCSFSFALFIVFLLKESTQFSRIWVSGWCASAFSILLFGKLFWVRQLRRLIDKGYFRRRVFLIGSGYALKNAKDSLLASNNPAELAGVGDLGQGTVESRGFCFLSAALNNAVIKGQSGDIDEILIALPGSDSALLDVIVRRLRVLPVSIKIALDLGDCQSKVLDVELAGAANIVTIQKKPISDWDLFLKLFEDYLLAILSLIIFLPAMAVIAVLIKLDSEGPIFFRQRRHGSNHKIIEVLKFRTMTVLEDGDEVPQATKGDRRITRVGRILRKTSLDELPQLLNVLTGEMSLVGPRPHALAHNNYYSKLFENYASRHRVKPGITGWAQVNGLRGEITDRRLMEKRVKYDLEYIDNWTIWFDLKILLLTPLFGFVSRRAY
jgi:putative colanic acid biosysnthesis UDP-glucose lipid carrier transferase